MNSQTAAGAVDQLADYYSRTYGPGAYEEALRYALVVRAVGDHQEHDFWLQVADALSLSPR